MLKIMQRIFNFMVCQVVGIPELPLIREIILRSLNFKKLPNRVYSNINNIYFNFSLQPGPWIDFLVQVGQRRRAIWEYRERHKTRKDILRKTGHQ